MHFVNANKIWNKNFMKQNKNRPSIIEINNIRAYHRELTYHRTPAVSMKHMCIQIQMFCIYYREILLDMTLHAYTCFNAHWYGIFPPQSG